MTTKEDNGYLEIGNRKIGRDYPPFIVAEMSGNHNQSLDRALEIVRAAARSGAHGLKIQTYTADTMTIDLSEGEFVISDRKSLWDGASLYELYERAHTPWAWHKPIFNLAEELGLICFSTPFDETAVDFLEEMNVPCYKVASFENSDLPLIRKIASTGKPVIISTGMATLSELDETVRTARDYGCHEIILLKCTSSYPASPDNTNMRTLPHMRKLFDCEVGLSDHTRGIGVSLASIAMGASMIEKHFTLSRSDGGVDAAFSVEPDEMCALVTESERAWQGLGKIVYGPTEKEAGSKIFRRSVYVVKDAKKGDILNSENLRVIRPGFGLPPKYYPILMGKKLKRDVKMGTPFTWELIE